MPRDGADEPKLWELAPGPAGPWTAHTQSEMATICAANQHSRGTRLRRAGAYQNCSELELI